MEVGQRLFDAPRAARLMQDAGIELIIASRRHSVAYLGGHFSVLYWEYPEVAHALEREDDGCQAPYYFVGLPAENIDNSFVIAHRTHIWQGRGWIQDVRAGCYRDEKTHPVRQIVACVQERGLQEAIIGVEFDHLPAGTLRELEEALPQARFVDATPVLWKMRMVKTPIELERQCEAYRIGANIYTEVFRALRERPDMTVGKVRALQMAMATEAGCPPLHFGYVMPQNSNPTTYAHKDDPNLPILNGDVLFLDLGLIYGGYTTDFARVAVMGRASDAVRTAYENLLELRRGMEELLRPGVRACDVFHAGADLCERECGYRPEGLGHGLGIECHEPPVLAAHDETILEAGMTIVPELQHGITNIGFLLEDGGVITDKGWQSLSPLSTDLIEIM